MKMSKSEAQLVLALLGVLAIVAVYMSLYKPNQEKIDSLKAESSQLKQQVQELEAYADQVEQFEEETKQMVEEVNGIFEHFPADSKAEDAIMYAVELEERDTDTKISSIGLSGKQIVYEATPCTLSLKDAKDEGVEHIYRLNMEQINYAHDFTYSGMKRYVTTIVEDTDRKSIETINLAFNNETGILTGNTVMNLYTIEGTDKVYQKTQIPPMSTGKPNIFSTVEVPGAAVGEAPEE